MWYAITTQDIGVCPTQEARYERAFIKMVEFTIDNKLYSCLFLITLVILIVLKHIPNYKRLLNGTENSFKKNSLYRFKWNNFGKYFK